jgi:hypothetical protein
MAKSLRLCCFFRLKVFCQNFTLNLVSQISSKLQRKCLDIAEGLVHPQSTAMVGAPARSSDPSVWGQGDRWTSLSLAVRSQGTQRGPWS